jgi:hypothetical protein
MVPGLRRCSAVHLGAGVRRGPLEPDLKLYHAVRNLQSICHKGAMR